MLKFSFGLCDFLKCCKKTKQSVKISLIQMPTTQHIQELIESLLPKMFARLAVFR